MAAGWVEKGVGGGRDGCRKGWEGGGTVAGSVGKGVGGGRGGGRLGGHLSGKWVGGRVSGRLGGKRIHRRYESLVSLREAVVPIRGEFAVRPRCRDGVEHNGIWVKGRSLHLLAIVPEEDVIFNGSRVPNASMSIDNGLSVPLEVEIRL
jgi:hypothetical protein